ncbi:MAG: hypothetical protein JWN34_4452 [Bryobacterales bacterium]|jgi:hypothetical protein|nr:hypothetical protein [Bryobacterales bacterium]
MPAKQLDLPVIDQLAATPEILRNLMANVSDEDAVKRPDPARWSLAEVLEHLAHIEGNMFRVRLDAIVELDDPAVEPYDQDELAAAGTYSGRDPEESFAHFEEQREANIDFLTELAPTAADRVATHPIAGRFTLEEMLNYWVAHDLSHIRQIAELVRATTFLPAIGNLNKVL